jgi:protein ImuB
MGDVEHRVGVADGLFAAVLAAHAAVDEPVVVPPGGSAAFLARWPVEALERPELADFLRRLGVRTLGAFAALPARQVLGRLGAEGAACREVAAAVRGELPGYRAVARTPASGGPVAQPGFWGEKAAAETRAEQALERLGRMLHPEEVVVGRIQGGRGPAERARLVPYAGRRLGPAGPGPEPWPGRLPAPSPALVLERPLPAQLVDDDGAEVRVTFAGLASGAPWRLSVDGGRWLEVAAWAGPWPVDERWWSLRGHRRRAYLQVVTDRSLAYLLVRSEGRWWVEGAYD